MKKIINGVIYNTDTAKLIAKHSNGCDRSNFHFSNEEIYQTQSGRFFLFAEGGGLSEYKKVVYGYSTFGETIKTLAENDVFEFLQNWNEVDLIESLFPSRIEKA
jgi:hypothetical protein